MINSVFDNFTLHLHFTTLKRLSLSNAQYPAQKVQNANPPLTSSTCRCYCGITMNDIYVCQFKCNKSGELWTNNKHDQGIKGGWECFLRVPSSSSNIWGFWGISVNASLIFSLITTARAGHSWIQCRLLINQSETSNWLNQDMKL